MKECSKCKENKPLSEFYKNKGTVDGYQADCQKCHNKYNKKYRKKNKVKIAKEKKKWQKENRERENERKKKSKNEWKRRNPDKVKAQKHRRRAKKDGNGGSFTDKEWIDLCDFYGNVCINPSCKNKHAKLTIDHVIPISKGGTSYIENIQPLCLYCNMSKGNRCATDYRKG